MSGSVRMWAALALAITTAGFAGAGPGDDKPVDVDEVVAQALRMAELIEDSGLKARAMSRVASGQAALGRKEAARATVRRARELADGAAGARAPIYLQIAQALEAVDLPGEARDVRDAAAEEIESKKPLGGQYQLSGVSFAIEERDLVGARMFADAIGPEEADRKILVELMISNEFASRGLVKEAREAIATAEAVAEATPDSNRLELAEGVRGSTYGGALAILAKAEAKGGRSDEARALLARARKIREARMDGRLAYSILIREADARHALGDEGSVRKAILEVRRLIDGMEEPMQVLSLGTTARILAEGGMTDEAREFLAEARRQEIPESSAGVIGSACMALHEWEPATAYFRTLRGSRGRMHRQELARAQARAGDREARAVLGWAEGEAEPLSRVQALVGLLEGIADRQAKPPKP